MRRLALLASLLAAACGTVNWTPLGTSGSRAGLRLEVVRVETETADEPWRFPPPGRECVDYTLSAVAVDGRRHDLRAVDFRAGSGTASEAVARCHGPQMEPTWVGPEPRTLTVVLLQRPGSPRELLWSR